MKRDLSNRDFEMAMKTRTIATKNELHQVFIVTCVLEERGGGGGGCGEGGELLDKVLYGEAPP